MLLTEKERTTIEDLRTQEKSCIMKYDRYSKETNDPVLGNLFKQLKESEEKHFDTLGKVLNGENVCCNCNCNNGSEYSPKATYDKNEQTKEKQSDCFLVTDCIGTEKLVSGEYNSDVFVFGDSQVRKVLADIQVEEQNHAEMLWKYKTVNGMS